MAVAGEQVVFTLEVNAAQAKRELGSVQKQAETLGGGLGRVAHGLDQIGGKAGNDARKAIGSLGFAMGSLSKETSNAINVVGDLAGAFAGGPLVAGIAAVGLGIGLLAEKYDIFGTKAEAAAKKAAEHFADLKKEIQNLDDALLAMATGTSIERVKQQAIVAQRELAARSAIEAVGGGERFARLAQYEAQGIAIPRQIKTAYDAAIEATKQFSAENEKLVKIVRNAQFEKHLKDVEEAGRAAEAASRGRDEIISGSDVAGSDSFQNQLNAIQERADALSKAEMEAERAAFDQHARDMLEQEKQLAIESQQIRNEEAQQAGALQDVLTEIEEEGIAERQRLLEEDLAFRTQLGAEVIGIGVNTTQSLIDGLITGQEHALEMFAVNVMRQAGTAMIGHGINALAGGIAANSLVPGSGVGAMGTGAGLIAGGIALGGAATGIEHTMVNGGQLFQALPDPTKKDSASVAGFGTRNRGSGSSRGDGAGVVYQFSYGVAGPQPDETAREIARQNRRARSRGFADESIVVSR